MAAYSGWGFDIGHLIANADMDTHQWKFVTTGSVAGEFKVATGGSGPVPLGVLQNDPRVGEPGVIRVLGTTRVTASNAVTYGDFIESGSHAKAIVTASLYAMGIALSALASGSGYIEVLLMPGAYAHTDNTP